MLGAVDEADEARKVAEELRRIAYTLERVPDRRHQARAFGAAARTVSRMEAEELRRRFERRTLDELPGIGKVIAGVIGDLMAGREVTYLEKVPTVVQREAHLEGLAARLMAALKGD